MPEYDQGILTPHDVYTSIPNDLFGIAINWTGPRTPLLLRLDKVPNGAPVFQMGSHRFRPRTLTLGAALDNANTTVTLLDATALLKNDVLKLNSGEYVQLTADPTDNTTITVRRAAMSTTAAAQNNATTVTVIGNARDGATDSPKAMSSKLTLSTQYMQTILHPYAVGGGLNSNSLYPVHPGTNSPLATHKMIAMQNAMDDAEFSAMLGKPEALSGSVDTQKMAGVRNILTTNLVTSPSDAAAYKAVSFQRDLLTAPRKRGGGQPDLIVCASNWMDAFQTWSIPLQLIEEGQTTFGRRINVWTCPFLQDAVIVESSLLPDFTAFSLTSSEVRWQVKRPLRDEDYGKSGDNTKGHMLMELAIEVDNESHHAWVEGVTAFSP